MSKLVPLEDRNLDKLTIRGGPRESRIRECGIRLGVATGGIGT